MSLLLFSCDLHSGSGSACDSRVVSVDLEVTQQCQKTSHFWQLLIACWCLVKIQMSADRFSTAYLPFDWSYKEIVVFFAICDSLLIVLFSFDLALNAGACVIDLKGSIFALMLQNVQ